MKSKCDILILTSSFGMGHNSVAKAIAEQLQDENASLKVVVKDLLDISNPKTKQAFFEMYRILSRKQPRIYNYFYKIKRDFKNNYIDEIMYNIYLEKVGAYIMEASPQLIISTFPLCSGFVSRVKAKYGLEIPLVTSITDVVDSWEWIHHNTDMYFVPCTIVRDKLVDKGIPTDKIKVTGIPVQRKFLSNNKPSKEYKQMLVMGGALGNVSKTLELLKKVNLLDGVKTVVITGSNNDLYKMLTGKAQLDNVEVLGYTNDVARFMDESDLIVTKPGGATLFEAINKGIPLVLKNTKVGQEEENVRFVANKGIGILIDDDDSLEEIILQSLDDIEHLDIIRKNIEDVRNEMEPEKIGQYALELM